MSYTAKVRSANLCEIYNPKNATRVCTIAPTGRIRSAVCSGDEVTITLESGRVEIYNARNGIRIRTL